MPTENIIAPHSRDVQELIAHDLASANELLTLLETENEALLSRDRDRISDILTRKQDLMITLEANAQLRESWLLNSYPQLQNTNSDEKKPYWEEFLKYLGGPLLIQQWAQLRDTVQECKLMNDKNGKVISRSRQTIGQLLDIVRGKSINAPKLYTAKGSTKAQNYSQSVTKA